MVRPSRLSANLLTQVVLLAHREEFLVSDGSIFSRGVFVVPRLVQTKIGLRLIVQCAQYRFAPDMAITPIGGELHVRQLGGHKDGHGSAFRALRSKVHLDVVVADGPVQPDARARGGCAEADLPASDLDGRELICRGRPDEPDELADHLLLFLGLGIDPTGHRLGEGLAIDTLGEGAERREGGHQGGGHELVAAIGVGKANGNLRDLHDFLLWLSPYVTVAPCHRTRNLWVYIVNITTQFLPCDTHNFKEQ